MKNHVMGAGEEEAQGSAAGEQGHRFHLRFREGLYLVIGGEQQSGFGDIELPMLEAPGVHGNDKVVDEKIRAGKIEIDEAGEIAIEIENIVWKQVGVDDAARQIAILRPVDFEVGQFGVDQFRQPGQNLIRFAADFIHQPMPAGYR